jgi:hypothetical protein
MGFLDKTFMKLYSKILNLKRNKTQLEQGTNAGIIGSYDNSKNNDIKPLTSYLKKILSN